MQAYCFRFYFLLVTVIVFVKMVSCVMRTVHHIMKGEFRLGLRAALEEVLIGHPQRSDVRMARG